MDFTLLEFVSIEDIDKMLHEVYTLVLDMSNIRLALKNYETQTKGYTFFINFSGPLGADITRGEIKTDFTTKEKLINSPINKTLLREYDEYKDIPENIELKIYAIEEIFLEKYLSILDKSRNEPRDIYDLWYLISNGCLDYEHLGVDIKAKGSYKGVKSFNIIEALDHKETNYEKLWIARLEKHMINLPHFEKVYRELKKYLKSLNKTVQ